MQFCGICLHPHKSLALPPLRLHWRASKPQRFCACNRLFVLFVSFFFFHLGNKKPKTNTEIVCILPFRFASFVTGRQDVIITCFLLICFLIVSVSVGFRLSAAVCGFSPILHATNNVTPPFLFRSRYSTPTPESITPSRFAYSTRFTAEQPGERRAPWPVSVA